MPLRKANVRQIAPFDYRFDGSIGGQMTDVGRNIGSANIGLIIQTVPPGNFSSRRHRHLFQVEILVVMSGSGMLHHGDERQPVEPGDAVCYLPGDPEAHTFLWSFGLSAIGFVMKFASIPIRVSPLSKGLEAKSHWHTRPTVTGPRNVVGGEGVGTRTPSGFVAAL